MRYSRWLSLFAFLYLVWTIVEIHFLGFKWYSKTGQSSYFLFIPGFVIVFGIFAGIGLIKNYSKLEESEKQEMKKAKYSFAMTILVLVLMFGVAVVSAGYQMGDSTGREVTSLVLKDGTILVPTKYGGSVTYWGTQDGFLAIEPLNTETLVMVPTDTIKYVWVVSANRQKTNASSPGASSVPPP